MTDFIAWHGRSLSDHIASRDKAAAEGYRFVSVSIYGPVGTPVFAAVMIKRPVVVVQRDFPCITATQWQQTFNEQAAQGFGPVILAATGSASDPRFSAVFQPQNPVPLTHHGLTTGDITDPNTIEGMNSVARGQGRILHWCASYGTTADPRFAAIWVPNADADLWNNEGLADDVDLYQARFNAEIAAWCRPGFVTLNGENRYMSVFVASNIGPWVARHNMTPNDYQTAFNTFTASGYFPRIVQAAGESAASAHFAALFVKSENTVARAFLATGPVANSAIDAVVMQTMQQYPTVRHASLAIVHGTKLVYARGYTLAEPGWPTVQPTTYFRLASVSKTITALAVFQLIQLKKLKLTDTLQGILNLKTPSGAQPVDPRSVNITIQNLLEHKSGLQTDAFSNGVAVVNAFKAAGHSANLPVTQAMTDSYIASLLMTASPGTTQAYSNCGYYLLGRVVAHLWGTNTPIEAYQRFLFHPLSITRIRSSIDLLSTQPPDEARYQSGMIIQSSPTPSLFWPDLRVGFSQQTPDQPIVASGYGDAELAIAQGAGGLSAATTDVARLIAIMIDENNNAALNRSTITDMLSAAAALTAAGNSRAGYGLDGTVRRSPTDFYGQKGGNLSDSASVLQFDDQWGFALCFGSTAQNPNATWYPDFPSMMNIAKNVNWGSSDLFPQFGMPSL